MTTHLDEVALEALATGREDLVDEAALAHLDECAECAAQVALEQAGAEDASLGLRRAMPELPGLDAMIAQAMEVAPDASPAPSRRSLWMGAGFGATLAVALGALSIPGPSSVSGLTALGRQLLTLGRAVDRVVESTLPGGWIGAAMIGLVVALALAVPTRLLLRTGRPSLGAIVTSALTLGLIGWVVLPSSLAHAYRVEGEWPSPMPTATVDVTGEPTSEALRQAAQSGGLGVVVRLSAADRPVTLHVQDAPMDEVFEAILGDLDVVVRPGASLVSVRPDERPAGGSTDPAVDPSADPNAAPVQHPAEEPTPAEVDPTQAPPTPPTPPLPPPPSIAVPAPPAPPAPPMVADGSRVGDRVTFGNNVGVEEGEVVRGVYTMGGNAVIEGRALGDVVTMGGNAEISGEVIGNVTTMGGNIELADGARVHGDLNAMGGEIDVDEGARVHGQVMSNPNIHVEGGDPEERGEDQDDRPLAGVFRWGLFNALLFLFGLFMLGTARQRFATMRDELVARPVRSGFGGFFGGLAAVVLTGVLTLTVIGIPGAFALAFLLVLAVGVGWTTSAWWLGSVLPIGRLKDRPVAQLAAGVGVLFLFGLVPKVGTLLVIGAVFAGLGAVIATELGVRRRNPPRASVPTGPFRTSAGG